jgi:hypothetical protein
MKVFGHLWPLREVKALDSFFLELVRTMGCQHQWRPFHTEPLLFSLFSLFSLFWLPFGFRFPGLLHIASYCFPFDVFCWPVVGDP